MVENQNKLDAAFLAGRADATAERTGSAPEGTEALLRMVLSESDCLGLARVSRVLFHAPALASPRPVPTPTPVLALLGGNERTNGGNGRGH